MNFTHEPRTSAAPVDQPERMHDDAIRSRCSSTARWIELWNISCKIRLVSQKVSVSNTHQVFKDLGRWLQYGGPVEIRSTRETICHVPMCRSTIPEINRLDIDQLCGLPAHC
jgi:hypothetical protein